MLLDRLTPAARPQCCGSQQEREWLVRLVVWLCHLPCFRPPLFPRACVRQSLALYYVLTRRGYPIQIHFGVRKAGQRLYGHSWVTVQECPVAEQTPLDVFRVVYSYPPSSGMTRDTAGTLSEQCSPLP
jgi:Transglutaminase-like superfamily